ncbi:MAG: endolytic transglycosylase MltG [Burkholderiaceae bacterium]
MLPISGASGYAAWWLHHPLQLAAEKVQVAVAPGASAREIAQALFKGGVETSPFLLSQWFRWSGQERKIRAGSYEIDRTFTPIVLLSVLVRGEQTLASVRLLEGWTFQQFRAELAMADSLKPTTAVLSDADIMVRLGAPGVAPEGRFFPDTYAYFRGSKDFVVLEQAYRAMQKRLQAAWSERAPDSPLRSADEALTLASIVEKETGAAAERGLVAGVFVNRLRLGMPLQTDPTVIYGLGDRFDGNLRKRDLLADTPYNTYTRVGLPPTPISMPGNRSLLAAVLPDRTKALYFVARGDGSSHFSETLSEHNRAVDKYQRRK